MSELLLFAQIYSLTQGSNINPLLFSLLLKGLSNQMREPRESVEVFLYGGRSYDICVEQVLNAASFSTALCGSHEFGNNRKSCHDKGDEV